MKTASLFIFLLVSIALEPPYKIHRLEIEAFEATNKFRVKNGVKRLKLDTLLCRLAREHSENMANDSVGFGHEGFYDRIEQIEAKMGPRIVGENCYMSLDVASGTEAVDAWSRSKAGHRENMLNENHKRVGIGIGGYGTFYTQIFCD